MGSFNSLEGKWSKAVWKLCKFSEWPSSQDNGAEHKIAEGMLQVGIAHRRACIITNQGVLAISPCFDVSNPREVQLTVVYSHVNTFFFQ